MNELCRLCSQHADHQFGINREASRAAAERRQLLSYVAKLDEPIDRAQQMIRWNVLVQRELIEQRSLFDLPVSHHDLQSLPNAATESRTSCVATDDFFNTICHKQTSNDACPVSIRIPLGKALPPA